MDTKIGIAEDLLARIGQRRIGLANQELATIPAALRLGFSAERVAHLTGAPLARVREIEEGMWNGERSGINPH